MCVHTHSRARTCVMNGFKNEKLQKVMKVYEIEKQEMFADITTKIGNIKACFDEGF